MNKIQALQDKAVRVIKFRANNYDVEELYKNDKILRISDYFKLLNWMVICKWCTNKFVNPPFPKLFY